MRAMRGIAVVAMLALAACGSQRSLRPQEGQPLPPAPFGAERAPTPDELLQPDTQQRPARSDELLRRSQDRTSDRFDLPPS